MNGADMLALARYTAHLTLRRYRADHEDIPLLSEADYQQVDKLVHLVALELAEQAGDRGRELWVATQ